MLRCASGPLGLSPRGRMVLHIELQTSDPDDATAEGTECPATCTGAAQFPPQQNWHASWNLDRQLRRAARRRPEVVADRALMTDAFLVESLQQGVATMAGYVGTRGQRREHKNVAVIVVLGV